MREIVLKIKSKLEPILKKNPLTLALNSILIPCILTTAILVITIFLSGPLVVSAAPSFGIEHVSHHLKGAETLEQEDIDSSYKMSEVGFSEKAKNGLRNKSHGIDSDSVEIQEQSFRYLGGELNRYGGSNYVAIVEDDSVYTGEVESYNNNDFDRLIRFILRLSVLVLGVLSLLMINSCDQEERMRGYTVVALFIMLLYMIATGTFQLE